MKIYVGSDHAGYAVKEKLKQLLVSQGYDVVDCGTDSEESCDFSDYAQAVAQQVAADARTGLDSRGILLCSTGMGMSIAANRIKGVRAGLCYGVDIVKDARYHDDINVLCLGSKMNSFEEMEEIIAAFLTAPFDAVERRVRRMKKLDAF